ncbi:hypothetical protein [Pseudanabaena sp. CCNP1317]|nr:hypothetical protein [Pseudanabaena sp. CCNP1317]MEA5488202.1 hypothetical protein [Pseudanabaena sp. CCNP1317]
MIGESVAPRFDYRNMSIANADDIKAQFLHLWHDLDPYVRSA